MAATTMVVHEKVSIKNYLIKPQMNWAQLKSQQDPVVFSSFLNAQQWKVKSITSSKKMPNNGRFLNFSTQPSQKSVLKLVSLTI